MKLAKMYVTDAASRRRCCETLIQTELGTYFILAEDMATGDVRSRRISPDEATRFLAAAERAAGAPEETASYR
ncbi:MAG: hypothetical protein H6907_19970 [Hyphomicrobiales bacterium]|nr:hypothetical protein [Hyphomicrobiales bacterium]MCP5374017.1 hypothetical protein [Hyphomicrobiales bacterium]